MTPATRPDGDPHVVAPKEEQHVVHGIHVSIP